MNEYMYIAKYATVLDDLILVTTFIKTDLKRTGVY